MAVRARPRGRANAMILDVLPRCGRYTELHPLFARAFEFLRQPDLASRAPGRYDIDGDRLYVSIDQAEGRGRARAKLEAHRRYIDIQYTLEGQEEIGWVPLDRCDPADPFDEQKDIGFFTNRPDVWIPVPPGRFVIFFPDDAHAPLAGDGLLKKAIAKIAVLHP